MTYRMIHFTKVFCFVGDKMKILFISLGCDKNLVDSEHMIGLLGKAGYEFTSDETEADIIIINSCSFIKDAKEESIETIFNMARMKEEGNCKALVLAGCLAQRYHEEIKDEIPEIDIVVGTTAIDDIVTIVEDYFNKNEKMILTYLETHDWLTNAAAREIVHVGTTAARSLLNGLVDRGYLRAEGENRGRKYYLAAKRPR